MRRASERSRGWWVAVLAVVGYAPAHAAPFSPAAPAAAPSAVGTLEFGNPAVDFTPGGSGPDDSVVYAWTDSRGVTHFTDQMVDFLARFRDRFQPVSLFVNPLGQPKR